MTDFQGFKHGGVTFPLPAQGSGLGGEAGTLLRDADPVIFYMLEFLASCLETHIGARLIQEVRGAGMTDAIASAVAMQVPMNPEGYLQESHFRFPLLAIWRERGAYEYMGQRKIEVQQLNCAFILPPMQPDQAEALLPILKAAAAVIDNRTEQGFDPSYTPSLPTGTAGEVVWGASRAGLARVEVKSNEFGAYPGIQELEFPSVVLRIEVKERSEGLVDELEEMTGVNIDTDVQTPDPEEDQSVIEDVIQTATYPAPVLTSIAPTTGTKAGGTPFAITGTGFIPQRTYRVLFGGSYAASVVAASATSLTGITPQYIANPTQVVSVRVLDQDDQAANTLSSAFTFTSP